MSMTLIEHIEVGSGGAASIVLDNIPQSYTDLYLVTSLRVTGATGNYAGFRLLVNTSTSITVRMLQGSGSAANSYNNAVGELGANIDTNNNTANTFSSNALYLPNYSSTTVNKSISYDGVMENNATEAYQNIAAGLYASTTAITELELKGFDATGTQRDFVQYSSATLYGITAGSDGTTTVS